MKISENKFDLRQTKTEAGRPGLVVMGNDSCLESRGFEPWHCILDGHFFTTIRSVTRWLDYLFNIWPFRKMKIKYL